MPLGEQSALWVCDQEKLIIRHSQYVVTPIGRKVPSAFRPLQCLMIAARDEQELASAKMHHPIAEQHLVQRN